MVMITSNDDEALMLFYPSRALPHIYMYACYVHVGFLVALISLQIIRRMCTNIMI